MKITVEIVANAPNEVVFRCAALDGEMQEALALLRGRVSRIAAQDSEGGWALVEPQEVLYADAVDGRVFLYTKGAVLRCDHTLEQLAAMYEGEGLTRAAKSQVVNLHHVSRLKGVVGGRIELTLSSGEKLIASRHYANDLRERLGVSPRKESFS